MSKINIDNVLMKFVIIKSVMYLIASFLENTIDVNSQLSVDTATQLLTMMNK